MIEAEGNTFRFTYNNDKSTTRQEQILEAALKEYFPFNKEDDRRDAFIKGADWADEHPNLDEWFDNIRVWLMNNDKLRRMIGLSNQYELVTELRKFLKNKQDGK